jgi:molybdopterin biosynthesis enzyme
VRRVEEKFVAEPAEGGSSALTTIVKSNGYAMVPPHSSLAKGKEIIVFLFNKMEIIQIPQQA